MKSVKRTYSLEVVLTTKNNLASYQLKQHHLVKCLTPSQSHHTVIVCTASLHFPLSTLSDFTNFIFAFHSSNCIHSPPPPKKRDFFIMLPVTLIKTKLNSWSIMYALTKTEVSVSEWVVVVVPVRLSLVVQSCGSIVRRTNEVAQRWAGLVLRAGIPYLGM